LLVCGESCEKMDDIDDEWLLLFFVWAVVIGVANFLIYSGAGRILLSLTLGRRLIPALRVRRWISNIPGNPSSLDPLLCAFFGPYPEQNDFNSVLPGLRLDEGPVLLRGFPPPRCRYWSLQAFLPNAKHNSRAQCLRDDEIPLNAADGSYTVVLSRRAEKPAWAQGSTAWIEVPDGADHCILCLRAYCPKPGEGFLAPDVWTKLPRTAASADAAIAALLSSPSKGPEALDGRVRVAGMWPAQRGVGSAEHRLWQAICFNGLLLTLTSDWPHAMPLLVSSLSSSLSLPPPPPLPLPLSLLLSLLWGGWSWGRRWLLPPSAGPVVVAGAVFGALLYSRGFAAARQRYRAMPGLAGLVPNVSVHVPNPRGELKGHPCHNYYTIRYDATREDVEVRGWLRGDFAYTSVHAYGWSSLISEAGEFRYDETLTPDAEAACGEGGGSRRSSRSQSKDGRDRYTVRLTTMPSRRPGANEIDVSRCPTGVCLVRLIYPTPKEIERCTPQVRAIRRAS
jgi:hypothetical protein